MFAGKEACSSVDKHGSKTVTVGSQFYFVHRVIWKIVTRKEPPPVIDHEDRDPANNRWLNLRQATNSKNGGNASLNTRNTSGHRGVTKYRGKWIAQIIVNRKKRYLGIFTNISDAVDAYNTEHKKVFGKYAANYL